VISPFLPIVENIRTSEQEQFAVLMDVEFLKEATALQDRIKFPFWGTNMC
jgi:UDP-glucose 6-dehydrogenase